MIRPRSHGAVIRQAHRPGLIERLLVRLGLLATPEIDAWCDWADTRLDELAAEERRLRRRGAQR